MPREQSSNIVYINGKFLDRKENINEVFQQHDVVQLRAKDTFIQMGIQLSEHFVSKGWATYDLFRSTLATDQEGDSVPQVTIKLRYLPEEQTKEKVSPKEKVPERKEYRQRERDQAERKEDRRQERGRGTRPDSSYRK